MPPRSEDATTYALIVTRRNASEILTLPRRTQSELPRVVIRPHRRMAEQLTAEIANTWGLQTHLLLLLPAPTASHSPCAVVESTLPNDKTPHGAFWASRTAAADNATPPEDHLIRSALAELDSYVSRQQTGPFAKPGWLRELFRWAAAQLAASPVRLTGNFRQLNASSTFNLIRLETTGAAVWFKATGNPNKHELPVTLVLSRLFPEFLPHIIGVHPDWNGWLAAEALGTSLEELTDSSAWQRAAQSLAELEIASAEHTDELLDCQLRDLRLHTLLEVIEPFLARMSQLMARQEKPTPAPLADSELRTLAERLQDAGAALQRFELPDTLGHLDFNPGNIIVSSDGCVFLDWAEACVTSPFLTLQYLREHFNRSHSQKPADPDSLTSAYLRPWASLYSQGILRNGLELSSLVAVFAYAVASNAWRSPDILQDPTRAGSFRSLTRRMYREAIRVGEKSEPCLL